MRNSDSICEISMLYSSNSSQGSLCTRGSQESGDSPLAGSNDVTVSQLQDSYQGCGTGESLFKAMCSAHLFTMQSSSHNRLCGRATLGPVHMQGY